MDLQTLDPNRATLLTLENIDRLEDIYLTLWNRLDDTAPEAQVKSLKVLDGIQWCITERVKILGLGPKPARAAKPETAKRPESATPTEVTLKI